MRKIFQSLFVFTLVFSLFGWAVPDAGAAGKSYTGVVDYVKDGDTIMLKQPVNGTKEVRFLGIDTAETFVVGDKDPGNQLKHGENAKAYLQSLLPSGTEVTFVTGAEEIDGYGRLLAYVYKGDMDINKAMLSSGNAVSYFIWPINKAKFEPYQQAMMSAKQQGLGIWEPSDHLEELPFEYRDRMFGNQQDKYVGDYDTKTYYIPSDYKTVPIEDRVFFFTQSDAEAAGYMLDDSYQGQKAELVITEVYYDAEGSDSENEYVEIYNPTAFTYDIGGYTLSDNYSSFALPEGTTISPGEYIVIAKDAAGFKMQFGFTPKVEGMTLALSNSGDKVELKSPAGIAVDMVAYENYVSGWDITADTGSVIYRWDVEGDRDSVHDWNVGVPIPGQ